MQVGTEDNALFSATLHELDEMVGCEERQWVCDGTAANRTFVDRYFLSGMTLPEAGQRIWRLTVGPKDLTAPHAVGTPVDITHSTHSSGLLARMSNEDGTPTTLFFPGGEVATPARVKTVSAAGMWVRQPVGATLPTRTRAGVAQPFCADQAVGAVAKTDDRESRPGSVDVVCRNQTDCTDELQQVLDDASSSRVTIKHAEGRKWITRPLTLKRSNVAVRIESGVVLQARCGFFHGPHDKLLTIEGTSNVSLQGPGSIRMWREDVI